MSIGFSSPRQREAMRASTRTKSSSLRASSGPSIVSPLRSAGTNVAGSTSSSPARSAPSQALDAVGQDGARVVAEMAEEPPEPLGAAHAPVRDHVHALLDPGAARHLGEPPRGRQRMPALTLDGQVREVLVDVRERTHRGCARRGRARARGRGFRARNGSPRTGSARGDCDGGRPAPYLGHEDTENRHRSPRRARDRRALGNRPSRGRRERERGSTRGITVTGVGTGQHGPRRGRVLARDHDGRPDGGAERSPPTPSACGR